VLGAGRRAGPDLTAGTGTAANLGSGGPDAFGYAWKDSNAPASPTTPTVAFQNITATGTQITSWTATGSNPAADEGYADVALPFAFPYYGALRNTVRISTNGFLTFSGYGADSFTTPSRPRRSRTRRSRRCGRTST
jgi:hypothetical protein